MLERSKFSNPERWFHGGSRESSYMNCKLSHAFPEESLEVRCLGLGFSASKETNWIFRLEAKADPYTIPACVFENIKSVTCTALVHKTLNRIYCTRNPCSARSLCDQGGSLFIEIYRMQRDMLEEVVHRATKQILTSV